MLELLVVMVIIGLLAGYVEPKYFEKIGKSETKTARAQIDSIGKALDQFRIDTSHYPNTDQGLVARYKPPENKSKWSGPYLAKSIPHDLWGKPYQYKKKPGEHDAYDFFILGKDVHLGGIKQFSDVVNW